MAPQAIINRLLHIEAWADGLREECRKTRKLIQGGVSTPTANQDSAKQVAELVTKRRHQLLTKKQGTKSKNQPS